MSSINVSEAALRVLLDKQEITEVLARYCRAIDRLDEELLRSVYWPDGYDDHMSFAGPVADFIPEAIKSCASMFKSTVHLISNILIEVEGDVARSETCFVSFKPPERTARRPRIRPHHLRALPGSLRATGRRMANRAAPGGNRLESRRSGGRERGVGQDGGPALA